MNAGTYEGDIDEIKFVKLFNKEKRLFDKYLNKFGNDANLWMVRVTTKQLSRLSNQKVFTRSDSYLIKTKNNINNLVEENDYYITEDLLKEKSIEFEQISFSGVSIKMTKSKNFQILKVGPNSFNELFGSYELGAGASLFCLRENELCKNNDLLLGWKTTPERMNIFFKDIIKGENNFYLNQELCTKIKNFSCNRIKELIDNSKTLQEKIFNGKDLYNEPYTAWYFYHGQQIEDLKIIPYSVTTGSGRSHGDYTIVLKPTNR